MSSSLYQVLQSCIEPQLDEPRILKLKLVHPKAAPPAHKYSLECFNKVEAKNDMLTGLSSIENISTNFEKASSKETTQETMEKDYVHPLIKRSASFLSDRSLEMCTESLGSETGSESSIDEIQSFALFEKITTTDFSGNKEHHGSRMRKFTSRKKRNLIRSSSFPPPLNSTRDLVHVKPHREGGRLVLKAVSFPHRNALFHAERSHGRLRLRLLKPDNSIKEDDQVSEAEDEEEEEERVDVDDHEEDEECDDGDDVSSGFWDMDGNNNMEEELVSARPKTTTTRRCKESEHTKKKKKKAGLWDLEPYWVAST